MAQYHHYQPCEGPRERAQAGALLLEALRVLRRLRRQPHEARPQGLQGKQQHK